MRMLGCATEAGTVLLLNNSASRLHSGCVPSSVLDVEWAVLLDGCGSGHLPWT